MVEFYAPWCPACTALQPAWRELSIQTSQKSLNIKTGAVDVTISPGLSGRFVVTALPTIFHVINGEFRQYKGPRDVNSMMDFLELGKWKQVEPVPSWKAPDSIQMSLVANFFKLSQTLRSIHTALMETYGLPTWGSYLIFAVATIFIGALLGLVLVCVIDLLYPPKRSTSKVQISAAEAEKLSKGDVELKEKSDDDNELINEDILDDATHDSSDAEKNSPSDTSEGEEEEETKKGTKSEAGDTKAEAGNTEVRKRRPRKAD